MRTQPERSVVALQPVELTTEDPEAAFRRLSERNVQDAYRLAWAILGDPHEAEEIAQDAFTLAWQNRSSLRDSTRFDAWFGRILVNCCRDRLRQRGRKVRVITGEVDGPGDDPTMFSLDRDEVYRAIAGLEVDQRIAVILRYWRDMAVDEIAQTLRIPSGTVKSRLHRAVAHLRVALEETL